MIIRISSAPPINAPNAQILADFLRQNPHCHIAYIDTTTIIPTIHAHTAQAQQLATYHTTKYNENFAIQWHIDDAPTILTLPTPYLQQTSKYSACQNAPIKLGCQIQPNNKPWAGTAGGPIKFKTPDGKNHWGLITNAHVSGTPQTLRERQIHQPTDTKPPIGLTTIYAYPTPNGNNYLDVALVDTRLDNRHTTSWEILDLGSPAQTWTNAQPGTPAIKTGRTTGTTNGSVKQINVAARINYGSFTAIMLDLDMIQSNQTFSAPGDSGSLILNARTKQPISLLFAGSATTTLAIPIRNIAKAINLSFKP